MADREIHELTVNGAAVRATAEPDATLLTVLRDELRILSPKRGCNQGVCGSCTVMIDGEPQRSCLSLAAGCRGRSVQTVEGLAGDAIMQALQRAMIVSGGVQCGFCTGGILISAQSLLRESPAPSIRDIQAALSGNLCRCTGYRKIIDAVAAAAAELAA
jgi:carbon-monoxide dehydrogenase small subunit